MARIRSNNVFGTTTDNPLTAGATTLNSAGLANLAAVSGGDEAIITLDPNRVNGAPEIVRVTAHTGSATSATIDRAEFDTTAREHPAGTEWVHGAVAATASDLDGDFGGFWGAWTPTLTNLTLGNGSVVARFTRIGNAIHWRFKFVLGSTSAVGTNPEFTLPAVPHADYVSGAVAGLGIALDAGTAFYDVRVRHAVPAEGRVRFERIGGSGSASVTITSSAPMTWTTSDMLTAEGTYEAA